MGTIVDMDHPKDENYEMGPPFGLECNLAHLSRVLAQGPLGPDENRWLDEHVPLFDTGIFDFKANEWYPFACELLRTSGRTDVWWLCCCDMQFEYPEAFPVPTKLSDPGQVRDVVANWFYVHLNKGILPKWNQETQCLESVRSSLRIKPEHIYAVLNAFATPELVSEVHKGLALNQTMDVKGYDLRFKDSSDTWRFASWLLSPAILGQKADVETFDIPDMGLGL